MPSQVRDLGTITPGGPFVKPDIGNFPGNPGQEFLDPWVADVAKTYGLPKQEATGSIIEAYRTGRYVPPYQDVSNLTSQLPIEQVYPNTNSPRLQPVSLIYYNILTSPSLGGKA